MRKKPVKKHRTARRPQKGFSFVYFKYILIGSLAVILLVGLNHSIKPGSNVLGISLLAENGMLSSGGSQPQQMPQVQPQNQSTQTIQAQPEHHDEQSQPHESAQQQAEHQTQQNNPQQPQQNQQPQTQQMNAEQQKQMQQQYQQNQQSNTQTYNPQSQNPNQWQQKSQTENKQESTATKQYYQQQSTNQQNRTEPNKTGSIQNGTQTQPQTSGQPQQFSPQQYEQMKQQYTEMRKQWEQEAAKNGFQIQPVPSGTQTFPNTNSAQSSQSTPSLNSFPTIRGNFNVTATNSNTHVNLNDGNTKIQLGAQNANLKARKSDGSEVEIDKSEVEKITTAIKLETGSEIKNNGDTFVMKRGEVEAQTKFPISFNVATKTFTVQTQNGDQEVKVLPDEVVQKLVQSNVINKLQTTSQGQGTSTTTSSGVQLTELNNQAVYQVEGTSQQKFFGFIPVSITKTTYVSAKTGDLVTTNQTFFSRFLDTVSF